MQEAITERFIKAYDYGLKAKPPLFKTQSGVAADLHWNQSTLNSVINGKRKVPIEIAIAFCDKYKFNRDWMLNGKGVMRPGVTAPESDAPQHSQPSITPASPDLQELITSYETRIKGLESTIQTLVMANHILAKKIEEFNAISSYVKQSHQKRTS